MIGVFGILSAMWFYVAVCIAGALMIVSFMKEKRKSRKNVRLDGKILVNALQEIRSLGMYGVILLYFSFLMTFFWGVLWTIEPLFYLELGMDALTGGLFLATFTVPSILFLQNIGKMADKHGKKGFMVMGSVLLGASLMTISLTRDISFLFMAAAVASVGTACSISSIYGKLADLAKGHKKGKLAGISNLFGDMGYVIGPLAGGGLAELFGMSSVFGIIGLVIKRYQPIKRLQIIWF